MNVLDFAPEILILIISEGPSADLLFVCKQLNAMCAGQILVQSRVIPDTGEVKVFPDYAPYIWNNSLENVYIGEIDQVDVVYSYSRDRISLFQLAREKDANAEVPVGAPLPNPYNRNEDSYKYMTIFNCSIFETCYHDDAIGSTEIMHFDETDSHVNPFMRIKTTINDIEFKITVNSRLRVEISFPDSDWMSFIHKVGHPFPDNDYDDIFNTPIVQMSFLPEAATLVEIVESIHVFGNRIREHNHCKPGY